MSEERSWPPLWAMAVVTVVLVGVPWAFKLTMAPSLGESCGGGFDCEALSGRCVVGESGPYCTMVCERDSDCPSSGHCGVPPYDYWRVWFSASPLSETVCVPGPKPDQPLEVYPDMPEPGAQFRPATQGGRGSATSSADE